MTTEFRGDEQTATLYQAILDNIFSGQFISGQRLRISELAKGFGVSASPVREALRQMQGEGFVEIHPNRGATIKQVDASTIQNIFEAMQLLEPYFISWFAENASSKMVGRLQAIQERIKSCGVEDQALLRKLDTEFHGFICENHYNDVAAQTWKRLRTALMVYSAPIRIGPGRIKDIIAEHDALIKACNANDREMADQVIRKHIAASSMQMSQYMRSLGL